MLDRYMYDMCVCACVRACVRARARARVCVCVYVFHILSLIENAAMRIEVSNA